MLPLMIESHSTRIFLRLYAPAPDDGAVVKRVYIRGDYTYGFWRLYFDGQGIRIIFLEIVHTIFCMHGGLIDCFLEH